MSPYTPRELEQHLQAEATMREARYLQRERCGPLLPEAPPEQPSQPAKPFQPKSRTWHGWQQRQWELEHTT
jgi:hypothetical protein